MIKFLNPILERITGLWKCKNKNRSYSVLVKEDILIPKGCMLLVQYNKYKTHKEYDTEPDIIISILYEGESHN